MWVDFVGTTFFFANFANNTFSSLHLLCLYYIFCSGHCANYLHPLPNPPKSEPVPKNVLTVASFNATSFCRNIMHMGIMLQFLGNSLWLCSFDSYKEILQVHPDCQQTNAIQLRKKLKMATWDVRAVFSK